MKKIEIELSKTKAILAVICCFVFVVLGIVFALNPEKYVSLIYKNATFIRIIGILALVFFSVCLLYISIKLFDKKKGLTIDHTGITDNSSYVSNGLINWKDINSISIKTVKSTSFLLIFVKNPEDYIAKEKNIKAFLMKANYKMYGTPICISSNSLKINFEDLRNIVETEFQKNK